MFSLKLFNKTIFISLLGHITVLGIFSLSFGSRIPRADFAGVSFWGAVLSGQQVAAPLPLARENNLKIQPVAKKVQTKVFAKPGLSKISLSGQYFPAQAGSRLILSDWWEKPQINTALNTKKKIDLPGVLFSLPAPLEKRDPMLLFHPVLPYGFSLYFKDRQVAHVEVMFNIESAGPRNSIAVKRKISSGNLEVDLLCARYIGHYLFIEQARFAPDKWQTVKIDLSEATTYGTK
ncbi:MAG: hypothetical protein V1925_00710 [Candidatus Omnitrophota bacterium]